MPRIARIVIPGQVYHITQRGNNRQDILFVPDDYRFYLELLKEQSERHGLEVLGYGLMTNHVHLVGIPEKEDSLAKALGRAHLDRKSTRLNSSHITRSRMPSSA